MSIKVIDLFAGPGGLGEGFSSLRKNKKNVFKIAISIEKEISAYRTLLLRSVVRQFTPSSIPDSYYSFLKGNLGKSPEEYLYKLPEFKSALEKAEKETRRFTLGEEKQEVVFEAIHNALKGEECILIGGPPCQAYSIAGRSRNYGDKTKEYCPTKDHRNFLYLEYLKVISKFQPKVFIMENVKGMLSAKINGEPIFESIIKDLENPFKATQIKPEKGRKQEKYRIFSLVKDNDAGNPKDYVVKAEEYGVPQARHRVILLGIREDLIDNLSEIPILKKTKRMTTVEQVISDLPKLRSSLSKREKVEDSLISWRNSIEDFSWSKLRIPDHSISEKLQEAIQASLNELGNSPKSLGSEFGLTKGPNGPVVHLSANLKKWYLDPRMDEYVTNHHSRGHISGDLKRYQFYSVYAKCFKTSPKAKDLPKCLWPNHKNFNTGKFADRFRVQLSHLPATTITSHISKDGHYFIHYDSTQCRSLTVREAARIQTFPDNYFFVGNRTQQYTQVGNAVPPYLAKQIAEIVLNVVGL